MWLDTAVSGGSEGLLGLDTEVEATPAGTRLGEAAGVGITSAVGEILELKSLATVEPAPNGCLYIIHTYFYQGFNQDAIIMQQLGSVHEKSVNLGVAV